MLWLKELGAEISGISLSPKNRPNHWDLLGLSINDLRFDIRDTDHLAKEINKIDPEIVFHLAAQPLVIRSYQDPIETWSTNVIGTVNLLDACRKVSSLKAVVIVTTDKVYNNNEWPWGYRENDILGGNDPYSASKSACEFVVSSYRKSFFSFPDAPLIASARAGNVIGGGDWSEHRLIPDIARATEQGKSVEIRSPNSTRPWQHVLESLSGYLMLGQRLLENDSSFSGAWNFGPDAIDNRTVLEVLVGIRNHWPQFSWHLSGKNFPAEASLLFLDSSKARRFLRWSSIWTLEETLEKTAKWYQAYIEDKEIISRSQLLEYIAASKSRTIEWNIL